MTQLGQWDDPHNGLPQARAGQPMPPDLWAPGRPGGPETRLSRSPAPASPPVAPQAGYPPDYPPEQGRAGGYPQDYGSPGYGRAAQPGPRGYDQDYGPRAGAPAPAARGRNRPAPVRGQRPSRGAGRRPASGAQLRSGAPYQGGPGGPLTAEPTDRRSRRSRATRQQAQAREMRWQHNRLAVPYYTDGPKITFGILWFGAVAAAAFTSTWGLAILVSLVAGLAGLQTGRAWFPQFGPTKWWTAAAAFVAGLSGVIGPLGIVAGAGMGMVLLLVYVVVNPVHARGTGELLDALARSSLPAGIAAASLTALRGVSPGAVLLLVAFISAYEAGDFLVGSGSKNAVEGPVSGLVALGVVAFVAWIVPPQPFTTTSVLLFAALAGVCCPLGQIVAAGLLPRGSAWAPALRRIDSYLLAAPLWLLLLSGLSGTSTL